MYRKDFLYPRRQAVGRIAPKPSLVRFPKGFVFNYAEQPQLQIAGFYSPVLFRRNSNLAFNDVPQLGTSMNNAVPTVRILDIFGNFRQLSDANFDRYSPLDNCGRSSPRVLHREHNRLIFASSQALNSTPVTLMYARPILQELS